MPALQTPPAEVGDGEARDLPRLVGEVYKLHPYGPVDAVEDVDLLPPVGRGGLYYAPLAVVPRREMLREIRPGISMFGSGRTKTKVDGNVEWPRDRKRALRSSEKRAPLRCCRGGKPTALGTPSSHAAPSLTYCGVPPEAERERPLGRFDPGFAGDLGP